jgi:hypothetical protein
MDVVLCYAVTDFFVWPTHVCHVLLTSGLDGSTYLSRIHLATPAWDAMDIFCHRYMNCICVFVLQLVRSLLILFETAC